MAFLFPKSFPFCIAPEEETKDIPVGSGTEYPIGMSLADAMFLFWKSKTFSSTVNFTGTAVVGPPTSQSFTSTYSQNGVLNQAEEVVWPNKMSEMICDPNSNYFRGEATGTGSITDVFDPSLGTTVILFLGDIIIRDKKYYPSIEVASYVTGSGGGFSQGAFLYSLLPEPPYGKNVPIQINDALKININGTQYKADLFMVINVTDLPAPPPTASFVINGLVDREAA
jgi:hypothetical protein